MLNIVFLDEYSINDADLSKIKKLGNYTGFEFTAPEHVVQRAANADILIVNKVRITADILRQLPKLKLICEAATGVDNIDVDAAAQAGIPVKNAKGYSTHSVAEATLGGAIALLRESVYYDNFVKSAQYSNSQRLFNYDRPTRQLFGKNWGIIGLGTIGHTVAKLAEAFGCSVAYHSVSGIARPENYPLMSLDNLLQWADIISLHTPLNNKSRGLISTQQFAQMKPSALLINVSRGGVVDEDALADALNNKTIAGACVDVFASEPTPNSNPLLHLNDPFSLLASPHNAWSARESIDNLVDSIANNISEFINSLQNN